MSRSHPRREAIYGTRPRPGRPGTVRTFAHGGVTTRRHARDREAAGKQQAIFGIAHLGLVDEDEHDNKHEDEAL